jgi:hypothetical protein
MKRNACARPLRIFFDDFFTAVSKKIVSFGENCCLEMRLQLAKPKVTLAVSARAGPNVLQAMCEAIEGVLV